MHDESQYHDTKDAFYSKKKSKPTSNHGNYSRHHHAYKPHKTLHHR